MSTGVPNGPYTGPVYSKAFDPGDVKLMGSNTWEGTYFVFLQVGEPPDADAEADPEVDAREAGPEPEVETRESFDSISRFSDSSAESSAEAERPT